MFFVLCCIALPLFGLRVSISLFSLPFFPLGLSIRFASGMRMEAFPILHILRPVDQNYRVTRLAEPDQ